MGTCFPNIIHSQGPIFSESKGNTFPRSYVPRVLCSQKLMFPRSYVPQVLCSQGNTFPRFYVPRVLCSQSPMFSKTYVPQVLCSQNPMFHRSYVPKATCSQGPVFPGSYVLKTLSSTGPMFPEYYVSRALCMFLVSGGRHNSISDEVYREPVQALLASLFYGITLCNQHKLVYYQFMMGSYVSHSLNWLLQ